MWVKVFFSAEEPLYDVPRSWEAPPLPFPSPWTSGSAGKHARHCFVCQTASG